MNYISREWFFPSPLILWTTIYFIVAYIKFYMPNFQNDIKMNTIIFMIGITGFIGVIIITNVLGLHISFFAKQLLRGNKDCNPFSILIAISLLNLFKRLKFTNKTINYVSSLSMLIYLIHENYLFRTYYRLAIWQWIYETYGYENILLITIIFVILLFLTSMIVSIIYKETLQKLIAKISMKIYALLEKNMAYD